MSQGQSFSLGGDSREERMLLVLRGSWSPWELGPEAERIWRGWCSAFQEHVTGADFTDLADEKARVGRIQTDK